MQIQRVQRLLRGLQNKAAPKKGYHSNIPVTTYNDLPIPQGSWKTNHDALQRKYNLHLLLGLSFLGGSLIAAQATGCLYLNYNHPDRPLDCNDYQS